PDPDMEFTSSRLEGVWWTPSRRSEIHLAVSNTTSAPLSASVSVDGVTPKQKSPETLSLMPHETRVIDLRELANNRDGKLSDSGGISIKHNGDPGALLAYALVEDASAGYSSIVEFSDPSVAMSSQLDGAGL